MPFPKGQSGNPAGRPKGTANKVTEEMRSAIADLLKGNIEQIKADFKNLKASDRVKLWIELLQYMVPKMQSMQLETDFDRLTDDQLNQIIEALRNPNYEQDRQINQATENTAITGN